MKKAKRITAAIAAAAIMIVVPSATSSFAADDTVKNYEYFRNDEMQKLIKGYTEGFEFLETDYGLFDSNTKGMKNPLIYAELSGWKYRVFYEADDRIYYLDIICEQPFTFLPEAHEAAESYISENKINAEIKEADMTGVSSILQSVYKDGFTIAFSDDTDLATKIKAAASIKETVTPLLTGNHLPVMLSYGLTDPQIATEKTKGDANCDGKITVSDAVAVLQYIANAEKYPLSAQGAFNADIDGVTGITGTDAIAIQCLDAGVEYVPKAQNKGRTYSTKEELISLMVSDDAEFSEHGFIYAPEYKFDAVLNAGSNRTTDYLIVYGLDPDECHLNENRWGYMPDDMVINTTDFYYALEPEFYCGSTYMPGALKEEYMITSESGNHIEVLFFMNETAPGYLHGMTDENWTENYGFSYMPYIFPDGADNN